MKKEGRYFFSQSRLKLSNFNRAAATAIVLGNDCVKKGFSIACRQRITV
jgi:hypothetical protein